MGVGRPYRDVGIQSGRHDDLISTLLCILQLGVRVIGVGLHGVLDTRLSVFANVTCVEWAVAGCIRAETQTGMPMGHKAIHRTPKERTRQSRCPLTLSEPPSHHP